jgi:hypothetical protein
MLILLLAENFRVQPPKINGAVPAASIPPKKPRLFIALIIAVFLLGMLT